MSDDKADRRAVWIGAFAMGSIALLAGFALLLGGSRFLAERNLVVAYFEGSVAGLRQGSSVTFRGVRIGEVKAVGLVVDAETLRTLIPVTIEVSPDVRWIGGEAPANAPDLVRAAVERGLRAQLRSRSFVTGQLEVDFDFRPEAPAVLRGDATAGGPPEVPTVRSNLDAIQAELGEVRIGQLVAAAERALGAVERLATSAHREIGALSGSVRTAASSADAAMVEAAESLRLSRREIEETLGSVRHLASDARVQLAGRGSELSRLLVLAERAVGRTDRLLQSANDLLGPRTSFRSNLEATGRDLSAAAGSLRSFAREVERNPSALLTGRLSR
ncbi:MCE family protein [Belnapia sp. T18]|uniref:MCE family protein n=1 Tax=Belnapia arida TaxID=2804533 RepID=A0ABS1UCB4_9PROT|nr:MlaD family protein [Belnapia arida]MBL6082298.1 MCE family protein [Belnapia arida]